MKDKPLEYLEVLEAGPLASEFSVALPSTESVPTLAATRAALSSQLPVGSEVTVFAVPPGGPEWCLAVAAIRPGLQPISCLVWPERSDADASLAEFSDSGSGHIGPGVSRWSLVMEVRFGRDPCADLQWVCQTLDALVPNAVFITDRAACNMRPGDWLRDMARFVLRPKLTDLYTIHAVGDENEPLWLHTHGLRRFGLPEIEILDAHEMVAAGSAVNAAAAIFLDNGVPAPAEVFGLGPEIAAMWLPWEWAIQRARPRGAGGTSDRTPPHDVPAAVLFAPKPKFLGLFGAGIAPLERQRGMQSTSRIFFRTLGETRRMAELARDQLPALREALRLLGDSFGVCVEVKLGHPIEQSADMAGRPSDEREHMWFEVHVIDETHVEATLLNEALGVRGLTKGTRGRFPLAWLTDWQLRSEYGVHTPANVDALLTELARPPSSDRPRSLGR